MQVLKDIGLSDVETLKEGIPKIYMEALNFYYLFMDFFYFTEKKERYIDSTSSVSMLYPFFTFHLKLQVVL